MSRKRKLDPEDELRTMMNEFRQSEPYVALINAIRSFKNFDVEAADAKQRKLVCADPVKLAFLTTEYNFLDQKASEQKVNITVLREQLKETREFQAIGEICARVGNGEQIANLELKEMHSV